MKTMESPLFSGISDSDISKMYGCLNAEKEIFSEGEVIFSFDENSDKLGIVEDGEVVLQRIDLAGNKFVLDRLEKNDVFGETTFYSNPYGDSVCVVAESVCRVVFISKQRISKPCGKVCGCHSLMINNLLTMISAKAERLSRRVEVLSNRSIHDKLMYYFLLEADSQGNNSITIPFSMTSLAEYLCVDRSAMMREIKKMNTNGDIVSDKRRIKIIQK